METKLGRKRDFNWREMNCQRLTISIAMCTYNGERFLQEQLDSFLNQTRLPDELVVCDDGSQDGTVRILEAFAARSPFPVRLFINPENLGFSKNFEKAISLCQGEIIALSDQDDVWMPDKLERFELIFSINPKLGYVFCNALIVNENLQALGFTSWEYLGFTPRLQKEFCQGKATEILLNDITVYGATLAFRSEMRNFFLPIPDFWAYDSWIVFLVSLIRDVSILQENLNMYRQHSSQCTKGLRKLGIIDRLNASRLYIDDRVKMWQAALSRFSSDARISVDEKFVLAIKEKIIHLNARSHMPHRRINRLLIIIRELIRGRYHRFSNGWKSIAKDILQSI